MNETMIQNHKRGFLPFGIAALMVGLIGGFTAVLGPAFVADMGLHDNNTTWIALALAMSTAACAPILGKLGDVLGRRTTLLLGIAIFIAGNVLTAVASSLIFMLVSRFIVGIGTAAIAPVIMAYIITEYPPAETAKGFATYMLISSAAVVVGPTVGGIIMVNFGWRMMMWVCVALSALSFLLCATMLKKVAFEKKSLGQFDRTGSIFALIFFSLLLCIPSFGQNIGWTSTPFLLVLGIAVIALLLLVKAEKKAANPIISGSFIKRKEFILPVVILFMTQGLMQANLLNTILFVRATQPENTVLSSFAISILYIGMSLGAVIVGPMADKKEPKTVLTGSLILTGIGCAIMMLFNANSTFALFASSLGILGFGLGGNATILMKLALSGLPASLAGSGSGTYGLFRDISAPFGVAVFVPLYANQVSHRMTSLMSSGMAEAAAKSAASVSSIHALALIEITCVVIGILAVRLLPKIHESEPAAVLVEDHAS